MESDGRLILICSPEKRCGTTLLQRLLCSSSDTLIFGEDCAHDLNVAVGTYHLKKMQTQMHVDRNDRLIEEVLNGDVNQWIARLKPPRSYYLNSIKNSHLGVFDALRTYSQDQGRKNWGAKLPGWNWSQIRMIQHYFSETKVVFLFRSLADCLRSAKSYQMINNDRDAMEFCNNWKRNTQDATSQANGQNVLFINYNDLVHTSEQTINVVSNFCEANDIKADVVLSNRINAHTHTSHSDDYIQPAQLSELEIKLVEQYSIKLPNNIQSHTKNKILCHSHS